MFIGRQADSHKQSGIFGRSTIRRQIAARRACLASAGFAVMIALSGCFGGSSSSSGSGSDDGNDGGSGSGPDNGASNGTSPSISTELVSASISGDSATGSQMLGPQYAGMVDTGPGESMDASGDLIVMSGGFDNADGYEVSTGTLEVFRRDMGSEELDVDHVSISPTGQYHESMSGFGLRPALSADGRYVAFDSSGFSDVGSIYSQIYIRDMGEQETILVSRDQTTDDGGQAGSTYPSISNDGSRVVFQSGADLIDGGEHEERPGPEVGTASQIYLYDSDDDTLIRISVAAGSPQEPADDASSYAAISGNGEYVVFESDAGDLSGSVDGEYSSIFLYNISDDSLELLSVDENGDPLEQDVRRPTIDDDGDRVVFAGPDGLYLWERGSGTSVLMADGDPLVDGLDSAQDPAISGDGRFVAYARSRTGNDRVYRFDLENQAEPLRVSVAADGTAPDSDSMHPVISEDGSVIAFDSDATNLISGDHDHGTQMDVYRAVID